MSYEKTWSGDWHARILERVRARGFANVTQYARAHVGVPLLVLADELGPDDVAAAQLRSMLVDEAIRTNSVPLALRDLLVRELRGMLSTGWKHPMDDDARFNVVSALVNWSSELRAHLDEERTFQTTQDFMNAELPDGWLPTGPDDPVIVTLVDRCIGRASS